MNSTYDYPLSNDYMWYKMILESFQNQTSKNDPSGYFLHQYKIGSDVFDDQSYFFKTCKEHTICLKEAFEVILDNNCQLPSFSNDVEEQVYNSSGCFVGSVCVSNCMLEFRSYCMDMIHEHCTVMASSLCKQAACVPREPQMKFESNNVNLKSAFNAELGTQIVSLVNV